ncbi:hypothetical protein RB623_21455 [Mesorhizobium sp. LHD-90]|uniref:hypothetical protein n=1 Tax=Mesorhizobium sp. LHD-90 TaxID=3071414 RepID=UPI0027DFDC75|nr:hypothetical protein [Mesorhizobium sp. LHD-90]MDQ6436624.1 hypothetical protein [Mesorhizobium sp. LHD-90]
MAEIIPLNARRAMPPDDLQGMDKARAIEKLREIAKRPPRFWTDGDQRDVSDWTDLVAADADEYCMAHYVCKVANTAGDIQLAQMKGAASDKLLWPFAVAVEALIKATELEEPHLVLTLCDLVSNGLFAAGRLEDPVAQKLANSVAVDREDGEFRLYQAHDFLDEDELQTYRERIRPILEIAYDDWRSLPEKYLERRKPGFYERPDSDQRQLFDMDPKPKPLPVEDLGLFGDLLKISPSRPFCSTAAWD